MRIYNDICSAFTYMYTFRGIHIYIYTYKIIYIYTKNIYTHTYIHLHTFTYMHIHSCYIHKHIVTHHKHIHIHACEHMSPSHSLSLSPSLRSVCRPLQQSYARGCKRTGNLPHLHTADGSALPSRIAAVDLLFALAGDVCRFSIGCFVGAFRAAKPRPCLLESLSTNPVGGTELHAARLWWRSATTGAPFRR